MGIDLGVVGTFLLVALELVQRPATLDYNAAYARCSEFRVVLCCRSQQALQATWFSLASARVHQRLIVALDIPLKTYNSAGLHCRKSKFSNLQGDLRGKYNSEALLFLGGLRSHLHAFSGVFFAFSKPQRRHFSDRLSGAVN